MTVGQMSALCWTIFGVMCLAFLPLGGGILLIHALPVAVRVALAIIVVLGVWWGPFAYAMYLSLAVMRNGDRRLLRRGIAGTAEVLTAKATNTVISQGEFTWNAPRLYRYGLRVRIPGREPYETTCLICAAGIRVGMVVNVAVSPHNRKRVTIDVGQGSRHGAGVPRPAPGAGPAAQRFGAADARAARDTGPGWAEFPSSPESQRLAALAQLGRLHGQGVLTDAEFAAEKTRILAE
jgi:hypothetical protein